MKVNFNSLAEDIKFMFDKYLNDEHIYDFNYDIAKEIFSKYEDKTWAVSSIPNYIADIFTLLQLQKDRDVKEKT